MTTAQTTPYQKPSLSGFRFPGLLLTGILFVVALASLDRYILGVTLAQPFQVMSMLLIIALVALDRAGTWYLRFLTVVGLSLLTLLLTDLFRHTASYDTWSRREYFALLAHTHVLWLYLASLWLATPILLGGSQRKYPREIRYPVFALVALGVLSVVSTLASHNPMISAVTYQHEFGLYLPLLIGWLRLSDQQPRFRKHTAVFLLTFFVMLMLGALVVSLLAKWGAPEMKQKLLDLQFIFQETSKDTELPRWRLLFPQDYFNRTAYFFLLIIGGLLLASLRSERSTWQRMGLWLLCLVGLYLIILTGTRGVLLALMGGLLFWGVLQSRKFLLACVVLGALGIGLIPAAQRDHYLSALNPANYQPGEKRTTSMALRVLSWKAGAEMIAIAPWTGWGHGHANFKDVYPPFGERFGDPEKKHHLHNVFLQVTAESGLLALCLFLGWILLRWRLMWHLYRDRHAVKESRLGAAWLAFEFALLLSMMVNYPLRRNFGLLTWGVWFYSLSECSFLWQHMKQKNISSIESREKHMTTKMNAGSATYESIEPRWEYLADAKWQSRETKAYEQALEPRMKAWENHEQTRKDFIKEFSADPDKLSAYGIEATPAYVLLKTNQNRAFDPGGVVAETALKRLSYNGRLLALTAGAWLKERRIKRQRCEAHMPKDRPVRVLRIGSSATVGGVSKVMNQTLLHLDPKRVETQIIIYGPKTQLSQRLLDTPGITVQRKPLEILLTTFNFTVFRSIRTLKRIIEDFKPDLIHLHMPNGAPIVRIAAAQTGIPLLIQLHSEYSTRRKFYPPLHRFLERQAMRHATLMGHAPSVLEDAWRHIGIAPDKKPLYLTRDGIDDQRLWRREPEHEEWVKQQAGDRKIVFFTARLIPLKRIGDFLTACRMLMDEGEKIFPVVVLYGGTRTLGRRMRRYFHELFAPGEAEIYEYLGSVIDLIAMSDIAVSCSEVEGLPKSILEYMNHDVAVVCSRISAHEQLVEHEKSGLLYELGNIPELVKQLRRLLHDEAFYESLLINARASIADRRWEVTAKQNMEIYRRILSGESAERPLEVE